MERHIQYSEIHRHNVHRILTHYHHNPSPGRKTHHQHHHPQQLVGINSMGHGYDGDQCSAVIEQLTNNTEELNNSQADFDVLVAKLIHELERLKEETKVADKSCEKLSFSTEMIKSFSSNKLL